MVDPETRDRPDIPASLRNEAKPATPAMVSAALGVPMWNHAIFADGWARASEAELAEMLGQIFDAMHSVRRA